MKAEHRKELETNVLADKMGHVMQRVKTGRRSTFIFYLIGAVALLIIAWFAYSYFTGNRQEESERWLRFDDGGQKFILDLARQEKNTPQGKAAGLQIAWMLYWDQGIKQLGSDPQDALKKIELAGEFYKQVLEDSKGESLFEPKALLGIAVVEEARSVQDIAFLEKAAQAYKRVVDANETQYKDTVEGKYAQARLDQLNNKQKRAELTATYNQMREKLDIRAPLPIHPNMPPFGKDLPPLPVEKK